MRTTHLILLALLFLQAPRTASAQDGISRKQQEKKLARKEKDEKKDMARREKDGLKRHLSIQDKETRKRLKRQARRVRKGGNGTPREGFPARLFKRKR